MLGTVVKPKPNTEVVLNAAKRFVTAGQCSCAAINLLAMVVDQTDRR